MTESIKRELDKASCSVPGMHSVTGIPVTVQNDFIEKYRQLMDRHAVYISLGIGKKFKIQEIGRRETFESRAKYLPDSASLIQAMKQAGIDTAIMYKDIYAPLYTILFKCLYYLDHADTLFITDIGMSTDSSQKLMNILRTVGLYKVCCKRIFHFEWCPDSIAGHDYLF